MLCPFAFCIQTVGVCTVAPPLFTHSVHCYTIHIQPPVFFNVPILTSRCFSQSNSKVCHDHPVGRSGPLGAFHYVSKQRCALSYSSDGTTIYRNVTNRSPTDTASHPTKFTSSATPPSTAQFSHSYFWLLRWYNLVLYVATVVTCAFKHFSPAPPSV